MAVGVVSAVLGGEWWMAMEALVVERWMWDAMWTLFFAVTLQSSATRAIQLPAGGRKLPEGTDRYLNASRSLQHWSAC